MRSPLLVVVLALAAAGCYSYTTVQQSSIQPGLAVRARVSASASDRIAPVLGSTQRVLTGKFISEARDSVILEVPTAIQAEIGSSVQTLHQRVSLPKNEILEWEVRTLNRGRTYALVGGAVILIGATVLKLNGEPGSEGLPGNGGVDARVLLIRLSR